MKTNKNLDIIIVNWNSGLLLSECLRSIELSENKDKLISRVVIVDNNSSDNSLKGIESFDLPLSVIKNSHNYGFAKACNQGAKESVADFLLFLNPDTRLFNNTLNEVISFLVNSNNDFGILGVKLVNENNEISRNCANFPTFGRMIYYSVGLDRLFPSIFSGHFMNDWDHKDCRIVDQVMGSFLLIKRELFMRLDGYDERFFVYYEDLDLSLRAKKMGYYSYYYSKAEIFHKGAGTTENVKAIRLFYTLQSKLKFVRKHFNYLQFVIVFIFTIFIEPITRIIHSLINTRSKEYKEVILGYKYLYSSMFSVKKRNL